MNRNAERKTVVIKKYENRRLYDTTNSRYVNLDEVAQAVRDGHDVQVVDAATGEDITRLILTQIIVENAKAPDSPFPLDVLRQMVVATGRASQEGALKYMKAIFDLYQSAYRSLPQPLSPFNFMMGSGMPGTPEPAPRTEEAPVPATPAASQEKKGESEVKELRRRIDELENMIARLGKPKRKSKARRR
jgi:polyhydroxyalkanoate synthesis repressor PhaR